jgi:hypothetical protein
MLDTWCSIDLSMLDTWCSIGLNRWQLQCSVMRFCIVRWAARDAAKEFLICTNLGNESIMIPQKVRSCHPKWCSVMSQKTGVSSHRHCLHIATKLQHSHVTMQCLLFLHLCLQPHFKDLMIIKQCVYVLQSCDELEIFSVVIGSICLLAVVFLFVIVAHLSISFKKWVQSYFLGDMSVFRSSADRWYLLHCTHARQHKEWNLQNHYFTCCFMWVRNLVSYIEGRT